MSEYCPCGSCQSARAWASVDPGMRYRGTGYEECEYCGSWHKPGLSNCPNRCRDCGKKVALERKDYCEDCYS